MFTWENFWLFQSTITNGFGCYLLVSKFLTTPWPLLLTIIWTVLVRSFSGTKLLIMDIIAISLVHDLYPRVPLDFIIILVVSLTSIPFLCIQIIYFLNPDAVPQMAELYPEMAALQTNIWKLVFLAFSYMYCVRDLYAKQASDDRKIQAYFGLLMLFYSIQCLLVYRRR